MAKSKHTPRAPGRGPRKAIDLAMDHLNAGRLSEAEFALRASLMARPNDADALNLLAGIALRKGDSASALSALQSAAKAKPRDAGVHFNLAGVYRRCGKPLEAAEHYEIATQLKRNFTDAEVLKGEVLKELGDWDRAQKAYETAIAYDKNSAIALNGLGQCLAKKREWKTAAETFATALDLLPPQEALKRSHVLLGLGTALLNLGSGREGLSALVDAAALAPGNEDLLLLLERHLRHARVLPNNPSFPALIARLFENVRVSPRALSASAAQILHGDQELCEALNAFASPEAEFDKTRAAAIAKHRLLLIHLRSAPITDAKLELWLTALRRALLLETTKGGGSDITDLLPLTTALATQAYLNEYVWYVADDEVAAAGQLLNTGTAPASWATLALLACYRPLEQSDLSGIDQDAIPGEIRPLLRQQIEEPAEERRIRSQIASLGDITDETSLAVRQQYEENPYPRWVRVGKRSPGPFREAISASFPYLQPDLLPTTDKPRVLIAGCGTGLETLGVLNAFEVSSVLAVDLSLSSLAYGIRKLGDLGITSVEYRHGDILNLDRFTGEFDLVHSFGVLHHMAEPKRGLAVLAQTLRPGGYILAGLYSRIARRQLNMARDMIAGRNIASKPSDIRNFRREILTGQMDPAIASLANPASDFWALSECRDLMFHVEEHQFTLLEIAQLFQETGLEFVGIEVAFGPDLEKFRAEHSDPQDLKSLTLWHAFEERNPDVFGGTYRLWARKPG